MGIIYNIKADSAKGIYDLSGNSIIATPGFTMPTLDTSFLGEGNSIFVDSTHRAQLNMVSPESMKGKDWTLSLWVKSYCQGSGNENNDWSMVLSDGQSNKGLELEVDVDHTYGPAASLVGLPSMGFYIRPFTTTVVDKSLHNIMMCRSASTAKLYSFIDGKLQSTLDNDFDMTYTKIDIGGHTYERNYFFHGWLEDICLVKDVCLHTKDFIPTQSAMTKYLNLKQVFGDREQYPYGYK